MKILDKQGKQISDTEITMTSSNTMSQAMESNIINFAVQLNPPTEATKSETYE